MILTERELVDKIQQLVNDTNQTATAAMLGISRDTVRNSLKNKKPPSNKLVKALGVERVTLKNSPICLYKFTRFKIKPEDYPPIPSRGMPKGSGVFSTFDGMIPTLRSKGYTLQEIGNKCQVSRERIRQILNEYYPDKAQRPNCLVTRHTLASLIGCSRNLVICMEDEGIINPIRRGGLHLYDKKDVAKIKALIQARIESQRKPVIELTCEVCDAKFYRKSYLIRKTSPGRFCSRKCRGVFIGNNYGFKAHPKNRGHSGRGRKWDYDGIYKLRDETGWGALRISRALNMPLGTVDMILQKRERLNAKKEN